MKKTVKIGLVCLLLIGGMVFVSAAQNIFGEVAGSSMVIAILDNGFDCTHPLLVMPQSAQSFVALDEEKAQILARQTSAAAQNPDALEGMYRSVKIPFAYDYVNDSLDVSSSYSNGTELAGLLGASMEGQEGVGMVGIVPGAQLLLMKVAPGETTNHTASAESVCRAISDAVILGADAIVIRAHGQEHLAQEKQVVLAIEAAVEAGVPVFAGAAEQGWIGKDSVYDKVYQVAAPTTDYVDYGTQGCFAQVPSLILVASIQNPWNSLPSFYLGGKHAYETYLALQQNASDQEKNSQDGMISENEGWISYTDTNELYHILSGKTFSQHFAGEELTYVCVDGLGKEQDFEILPEGALQGKIALIARGEINFTEKIQNAAQLGAIGVIVYEANEEEESLVQMNIEGVSIPAVFVDYEDGQRLCQAERKVLYIRTEEQIPSTLSENVSRGAGDLLEIAPAFAARGDSVMVTIAGGGVAKVSDSTCAAANAAGMYVTIKAAQQKEPAEETDRAIMEGILQKMAATAEPVMQEDGIPVSVRTQGAGFLQLDTALKSKLLFYNSATKESKTELGDHFSSKEDRNGAWKILYLTVENKSDEVMRCNLSVSVFSDASVHYDREELIDDDWFYQMTGNHLDEIFGLSPDEPLPGFLSGESEVLSQAVVMIGDFNDKLNEGAEDHKPAELILEPYEKRQLKIRIVLPKQLLREKEIEFPNGFFVEGYVTLTPLQEDAPVLRHPYMGFFGDWSASPAVSENSYQDSTSFYNSNVLSACINSYFYQGPMVLGENMLVYVNNEATQRTEAAVAISPSNTRSDDEGVYADGLNWSVIPMRTIARHQVCIRDADTQEVVFEKEMGRIEKGIPQNGTLMAYVEQIWSCRAEDQPLYIYPDGEYVCEILLEPVGSKKTQKICFSFVIDSTAPILQSAQVNEDEKQLVVLVSDNHFVQKVYVHDGNISLDSDQQHLRADGIAQSVPGEPQQILFDLERYLLDTRKTSLAGTALYIEIVDYAYNICVYKIAW